VNEKKFRGRYGGGPPKKVDSSLSYSWFDITGLTGVILIVVAYLLLQLGKLPSSAPAYSVLNALGALLVMVSLYFDFNLSAFLMEAFWFVISLFGLLRTLTAK
jgi:hypothetical protein